MGQIVKAVLSRNVGDEKPASIAVWLPVYRTEDDKNILHPDVKRFLGNDIEIMYPCE
jgi:type III secretory pathway lipoprotein EscJ